MTMTGTYQGAIRYRQPLLNIVCMWFVYYNIVTASLIVIFYVEQMLLPLSHVGLVRVCATSVFLRSSR